MKRNMLTLLLAMVFLCSCTQKKESIDNWEDYENKYNNIAGEQVISSDELDETGAVKDEKTIVKKSANDNYTVLERPSEMIFDLSTPEKALEVWLEALKKADWDKLSNASKDSNFNTIGITAEKSAMKSCLDKIKWKNVRVESKTDISASISITISTPSVTQALKEYLDKTLLSSYSDLDVNDEESINNLKTSVNEDILSIIKNANSKETKITIKLELVQGNWLVITTPELIDASTGGLLSLYETMSQEIVGGEKK